MQIWQKGITHGFTRDKRGLGRKKIYRMDEKVNNTEILPKLLIFQISSEEAAFFSKAACSILEMLR